MLERLDQDFLWLCAALEYKKSGGKGKHPLRTRIGRSKALPGEATPVLGLRKMGVTLAPNLAHRLDSPINLRTLENFPGFQIFSVPDAFFTTLPWAGILRDVLVSSYVDIIASCDLLRDPMGPARVARELAGKKYRATEVEVRNSSFLG